MQTSVTYLFNRQENRDVSIINRYWVCFNNNLYSLNLLFLDFLCVLLYTIIQST